MDASVNAAKLAAQEAWVNATYQNSWTTLDGAIYHAARYYKDTLGTVHLSGLVKDGTTGVPIFTLPAGYRPLKQLIYMVISNGAVGRLDILPTGAVQLVSGSNAYVTLEGITFRSEA